MLRCSLRSAVTRSSRSPCCGFSIYNLARTIQFRRFQRRTRIHRTSRILLIGPERITFQICIVDNKSMCSLFSSISVFSISFLWSCPLQLYLGTILLFCSALCYFVSHPVVIRSIVCTLYVDTCVTACLLPRRYRLYFMFCLLPWDTSALLVPFCDWFKWIYSTTWRTTCRNIDVLGIEDPMIIPKPNLNSKGYANKKCTEFINLSQNTK